jgi:NitT/TauT family transport system substrate-binding protein
MKRIYYLCAEHIFSKQHKSLLLSLFFLLFFHSALMARSPAAIRFLPQWTHQAQFAGFYMALDKGFYEEEGLSVTILDGGPQNPVGDAIKSGKAEIVSSFFSSALSLRNEGLPIVNICQYSKRSALMVASKKSRLAEDIQSLNGIRIGLWHKDFREMPLYFFNSQGLTPEIIPIKSGIQLFLNDGVEALVVMWYNELHRILSAGYTEADLNMFHFFDYGINMPEDGLFCREDYYEENQRYADAFVSASLRGWQYAFTHKDEALEAVLWRQKATGIPANLAHEGYMLDCMQTLLEADAHDASVSGYMSEKAYMEAIEIALKAGIIEDLPQYQKFIRTGENLK